MAKRDYDDEPETAEEMLELVRESLAELDERLTKLSEKVEDSGAAVRLETREGRKEMLEVRSAMGRLQQRFDNQLMVLVLSNIASGVGVAAVVLGASRAF